MVRFPFHPALPCGLAVLAACAFSASTRAAAYTYTTLNHPLATNGPGSGTSTTYATGIDGNAIVGSYHDGTGDHGFLYNGSSYSTLNYPLAQTFQTRPQAISGATIVGYYYSNLTGNHGFTYNAGTWNTLDYPGATNGTEAYGISGNNIVGSYNNTPGDFHGFLYDGATFTPLNHPQATTGTSALGISGNIIVGGYTNLSGQHGFTYDLGTSQWNSFDVPGSDPGTTTAWDIDGALIVGSYRAASANHGFVFDGVSFTTIDHPQAPLGGTHVYGTSNGRIVGAFVDATGDHGFVAEPIPEPAGLGLLGIGALMLLRGRQNRGVK